MAANLNSESNPPATSPTYWRRLAIDTLLELAAVREELDADRVDALAARWLNTYELLGGNNFTLSGARARVRAILAVGDV